MPLKLVRRSDVWHVTGTVAGKRVRESTETADRERAEAFRARREAELWDRRFLGERAVVSFPEAVNSYLKYHDPNSNDQRHIRRLLEHFRTEVVGRIDQSAVDRAIEAIVPGAAPATAIRSVITPLTSILNHAAARKWCDAPKFQRPALPREETTWLTPAQALALIDAAAPHLQPLLRFLLCTGARLSEALDLRWEDVHLVERFVMLRDSKNGRDRKAALSDGAFEALANLEGREGAVFRRDDGEPYADRLRVEGGQIRTAFNSACRRAGLLRWGREGEPSATMTPVRCTPAVTPHDLRHTWATWFYAVSKDLLLLRHEGDWSSTKMVERYAHLMQADQVVHVWKVWGAVHPRLGVLPGADTKLARREPG